MLSAGKGKSIPHGSIPLAVPLQNAFETFITWLESSLPIILIGRLHSLFFLTILHLCTTSAVSVGSNASISLNGLSLIELGVGWQRKQK